MTGLALLAVLGAVPAAAPGHRHAHATIALERPQLVLGVDKALDLTIVVRDNEDGGVVFALERALASVGTITGVVPVGRDRLTARYVAPAARFPQVAIIVIDLVGGGQHLRATTRLPLAAATRMPFQTSPGAEVSVRIEDRRFGPVRADAQGNVAIPIVVPPGVRDGLARATDPSGSTRETAVDLQPAPFTQLMIVAAPRFEVGSFAEVSTFAVTARGEPIARGSTTLRASEGMVHPLGSGADGEERFLVEAPRKVGGGTVDLVATAFDVAPEPVLVTQRRAEVAVPLIAGPAERLVLSSSTDRLIIGEDAAATVTVSGRDRHDNPTSCAGVEVLVDHRAAAIAPDDRGCGRIVVRAPSRPVPNGGVEIEARLRRASAKAFIHMTSGPAVRLEATVSTLEIVGDGHRSVELRVEAFDRTGRPTPVTGLHWQTAGGHLGQVRLRQIGTYVTQFTPNRTQTARTEVLVVKGSASLSATTMLRVEPPRSRLSLAARVGLFTNFGSMAGPIATIEGLQALPGRAASWAAGFMVSVLQSDITAMAGGSRVGVPNAVLKIDQLPCLAVAQYRLPLPTGINISVGGGVGVSFARTTIHSSQESWPPGRGAARAPAAEARAAAALPLTLGEVVMGLHYLWIDLGRTSQGDEINGNSVGFVGDAGFRMAW